MDTIPDDLLRHILTRYLTPTHRLVSCWRVCKQWQRVLTGRLRLGLDNLSLRHQDLAAVNRGPVPEEVGWDHWKRVMRKHIRELRWAVSLKKSGLPAGYFYRTYENRFL
jgi:hypothetical protein